MRGLILATLAASSLACTVTRPIASPRESPARRSSVLVAQDTAPKPGSQEDHGDLGQTADDPTASLMAVQVADWYTAGFHRLSGEEANSIVLRPVIPFRTGQLNHIFRATIPFITSSPALDTGLSDVTLFDLIVFQESWGRWGVGPVLLLPTGGKGSGTEQWAAGPAVGFTAKQGKLLWGLFNQNLITFAGDDDRADVNVSTLQPIVNFALGSGWTTGASEMSFVYDWEDSRWSSLPLGAKLAKVVRMGELPVQVSLQYEHDFAGDEIGPADTLRFTLKFLFPR